MQNSVSLRAVDRMEHVGKSFVHKRQKLRQRIRQNIEVMASDGELYSMDKRIQKHCVSASAMHKIIGGRKDTAAQKLRECIEMGVVMDPVTKGRSKTHAYTLEDQIALRMHLGRPYNSLEESRGEFVQLNKLVIAIANRKGGTGKTTVVQTLAAKLALDPSIMARVLVIDFDTQGSDITICQLPEEDDSPVDITLTDALLSPFEDEDDNEAVIHEARYGFAEMIKRAPYPTHIPTLHVLPSLPNDERLVNYEGKQEATGKVFDRFKAALEALQENYDYILFDTPPSDSIHTWLAMDSADYILTPFRPHELDFDSTALFLSSAPARIRELSNQGNKLKDFKVLITDFDMKSPTEDSIKHRTIGLAAGSVITGQIQHSEAFKYATETSQTIWDVAPADVARGQLSKAIESTITVYDSFKQDLMRLSNPNNYSANDYIAGQYA